ncbi:MAG: peptidoglycan editing factor PgeF [Gammaproteobacteria bacterium]|nr:peptidoglycan editing factor PgeF [Gammaproteobacteria bacterium]NIR84239.1 peptidoglycan editing factor PgeF [Gammaproteobacteria bacterium]NIR89709.1 peptidoglycan editing factor PgeF [Gammaproteobacteria bacterium]NIU05397.1 peptidoglycan editing factor PgeF [Gammaproteobacteria bacterium]NIV52343.1 peptidoglycan editing factor PgeF [Gammaproteobacteria bacterium]
MSVAPEDAGSTSRDAAPHILPQWPAPRRVRAATTTRSGGYSEPPYHRANLALDVGDDPRAVSANRTHLVRTLHLPEKPRWLHQVHGTRVVAADAATEPVPADACISRRPGQVCAVLTADCLPVLLCDRSATCVAAAHAGWRGLSAGVLEATVGALGCAPADVLAWLGPAIGPDAYQVGPEVREAFVAVDPGAATAFAPCSHGRWLADLYALARQRLGRAGVTDIQGGGACTFHEVQRFFSYRRDGRRTGRMATLIWLEPDAG